MNQFPEFFSILSISLAVLNPGWGCRRRSRFFFGGGGWLVGTMVAVYVAVHSPQGSVCPLGEGTATHRLVPWGCGINVACSQNVAVGELKSN